MRVLFVTSECVPFFKRGGLGDVSYSLPVALSKLGVRMSIVMPYYEKAKVAGATCVGQMAVDFDRRRELIFIFKTTIPGTDVETYLLRHPRLNEYGGDNIADTFAFFSKAVTELYLYSPHILGGIYDIVHCNDWHTALVPLLLGERRKLGYQVRETLQSKGVKTVLTIHNLLYKGETGIGVTLRLGLPIDLFHVFTTPLGRAVKLLREGLEYADVITTVSPTYAREIIRGAHGDETRAVLTKRRGRLVGILNGIDPDLWDPKTDSALPVHFDGNTVIPAKREIKIHLQEALGLPVSTVPLFGFVGRLEFRQKGIDLIARAVEKLPSDAYQLVLLGTGSPRSVRAFERLAKKHSHIAFVHTFDERLARRMYAGCDVMVVPSKFEPCGLTQMIAFRYGTIPLVRKTGGLADSVIDGKTGFVFGPYTGRALIAAMERAIALFTTKPDAWTHMVHTGMKLDFSWRSSAKAYKALYKKLLS